MHVIEPHIGTGEFDRLLTDCLESNELAVIIARRPCILIAKQLKQYEANAANAPPHAAAPTQLDPRSRSTLHASRITHHLTP